jgi:hypothetical protein
MLQYRIECECGCSTWANASLAGEQIACGGCGNQIRLPSLGKMKSLESRHEAIIRTNAEKRQIKTKTRSKVDELAIFTTGFGIVILTLIAWIVLAIEPQSGVERSSVTLIIPVVAGAVLVLLGVAVKTFRNKATIIMSLVILSGLFVADAMLYFNVGKFAISGVIVAVILKGGYAAIREIDKQDERATDNIAV